jgi:hypothetical protein
MAPKFAELQQQFNPAGVFVGIKRFNLHCNPVDKQVVDPTTGQVTETPITNPTAHLACWIVSPNTLPPPMTVLVSNQFGTGELTTIAMRELCLPSFKSDQGPANLPPGTPAGLDHFTCYTVAPVAGARTFTPPATVKLSDQWHLSAPATVKVTKPVLLCLPTQKTVDPANPGTPPLQGFNGPHLLCFAISPAATAPVNPNLYDGNQFGIGPITPKAGNLLCLPSTKQPITPGG